MQLTNTAEGLHKIVALNVVREAQDWIDGKLQQIISSRSPKDLYLTYSLLAGKVKPAGPLNMPPGLEEMGDYLLKQQADILQVSRIYLLAKVLEADRGFFMPKVSNLVQVADTGELEAFLKYLILLPHPEDYKNVAVEALRTNIATVFDAIALNNPYPTRYFNDHQWNQMYLKAAFMQRDLGKIQDTDSRANRDLARIISDYAHERWAASRDVDPLFWRPVTQFIEGPLLQDMQHLLESGDTAEMKAAALCCYYSKQDDARRLLQKYQELEAGIESGTITWTKLKE